jgi:hypothetical protein
MLGTHLTECPDIDILVITVACDGWVIVWMVSWSGAEEKWPHPLIFYLGSIPKTLL